MAVKVQWPDASRLVPFKTKSLKIVIDWVEGGKTTLVDTKVVDRPDPLKTTVTETVFNLKSGSGYRLTVTAHPNAGGAGTALARHVSAANLAIKPGVENPWPITMASTVHTVSIEPALTSIGVGEKQIVSVNAKDASGATVLLALSAIRWIVGSPTVLRADQNVQGLADNQVQLEGLKQGSSTLSVMDDESKKQSAALQLSVSLSQLSISPANTQLDAWSYRQFTASGGTEPYSWSQFGGLQIDQSGLLLAGRVKGSGTVQVRDAMNQTAVATFQVISTILDIGTVNPNGAPIPADVSITSGTVSHLSAQHYVITAPAGTHTLTIANSSSFAMYYQIGGQSNIRLVNSWEEAGWIAIGDEKSLLVVSD